MDEKMSIKDKYKVRSIDKFECKDWILNKHYARRMPMAVEYSFGLFDNDRILQGVAIFGPTAPPVPVTIFGDIKKHKVRELTRLVINEGLEKNILSFFLSSCFYFLPKPICLVSFADSGNGHHGYIYQATNWIYTGEGGNTKIHILNNVETHSLTISDNAKRENITTSEYIKKHKVIIEDANPKFRYLYFLGNKNEKKKMYSDLLLKKLPYPKGENQRYDASYKPEVQLNLF